MFVKQWGSVDLYEESYKALCCGDRIDDCVIGCHCEIQKQRFEQNSKKILFLPPPLVNFMQTKEDSAINDFFQDYKWSQYSLIFFPLSNLSSGKTGHWSLLMWNAKSLFCYLDSIPNFNLAVTKDLVQKIQSCFKLPKINFKVISAPKQTNDNDCGVYMMAIYDYIATLNKITKELVSDITPVYISNYRSTLSEYMKNPSNFENNWEKALEKIRTLTEATAKAEGIPA